MNHKPVGIPLTKLLAEMPIGPVPALYLSNTNCANCGRHGWCIFTFLSPTPEQQLSIVPYCAICLVSVGMAAAQEPLEHHEGTTPAPPIARINRPGGEN